MTKHGTLLFKVNNSVRQWPTFEGTYWDCRWTSKNILG